MKIHLKSTQYKDVMLKTWTAKSVDSNRGFTDQTIGSKTYTADELSTLVGDMLETILSFIPEITQSSVLNKATSINFETKTTLYSHKIYLDYIQKSTKSI